MVNNDITQIYEYYNLYNVVDEEFQKILNSLSENKELPNEAPQIQPNNQITAFTTPKKSSSKKSKQRQHTKRKKKNLNDEIKRFKKNIDTLTD